MKNRISDYGEHPGLVTMTRLLCGCTKCGRRLVDIPREDLVVSRRETFALFDDERRLTEVLCRACAEQYVEQESDR